MYRFKYTGTRLLASLALTLSLFAACSVDDADSSATEKNNGTAYLSIAINVADETGEGSRAASRAYDTDTEQKGPSGGETGDGTRKGENWENKVNNVTMLIYKSQKTDLTDTDATILDAFYFDAAATGQDGTNKIVNKDNTNRTYLLLTTKIPLSYLDDDYHLLLIANAGDLTTKWRGRTIGQFREATFTWDKIITPIAGAHDAFHKVKDNKSVEGGYENFVMVSSEDVDFKTDLKKKDKNGDFDGSKEKPYIVEADICRLAARIDFCPNPQNLEEYKEETGYPFVSPKASVGYCYDIKDGTKLVGGFSLEYVVPYNQLQAEEYYVIHGKEDKTSESKFFDSLSKITTPFYIVDPQSASKASLSADKWKFKGTQKTDWLTHTDKDNMFKEFYAIRDGEGEDTDDKQLGSDGNKESKVRLSYKFYTVDYVQENTSYDNNPDYATCLLFKGKKYKKSQWDATKHEPLEAQKNNGKDTVYTYVIRHVDPNGTATTADKMYYGIVRNNIYRVRLESISGKDDGIKCSVNVRKWYKTVHDEVNL